MLTHFPVTSDLWPHRCSVYESVVRHRALSDINSIVTLVSFHRGCRRCSCQKEEVYCFPDYLFHSQGIGRMLFSHLRPQPGLLCGVESNPHLPLLLIFPCRLPSLSPSYPVFNTFWGVGRSFIPPAMNPPSFLPSLLPSFRLENLFWVPCHPLSLPPRMS